MNRVVYWAATGLLAAMMLLFGAMNLMAPPEVVENLASMGYPAFLARILGVWKLLAVAGLLAPLPRWLKDSTYAGLLFLLTGAVASHLAAGQGIAAAVPALVGLALWGASLATRAQAAAPAAVAAALAALTKR